MRTGDADRAVVTHSAEVIAHQIDNHHVLRPVLARALERDALLAGGHQAHRTLPCPLDRRCPHAPAAALEKQLGRQAHDRAPWPLEKRPPTRSKPLDAANEQLECGPVEAALELGAHVGLQQVAGVDRARPRARTTTTPQTTNRRRRLTEQHDRNTTGRTTASDALVAAMDAHPRSACATRSPDTPPSRHPPSAPAHDPWRFGRSARTDPPPPPLRGPASSPTPPHRPDNAAPDPPAPAPQGCSEQRRSLPGSQRGHARIVTRVLLLRIGLRSLAVSQLLPAKAGSPLVKHGFSRVRHSPRLRGASRSPLLGVAQWHRMRGDR